MPATPMIVFCIKTKLENERPNNIQKAIFMNNEPRQFTDFSSGQDGWGNDDDFLQEMAEKRAKRNFEDAEELEDGSLDDATALGIEDN